MNLSLSTINWNIPYIVAIWFHGYSFTKLEVSSMQEHPKGFVQFFWHSKYSTNILQKVQINCCIKNIFNFPGQLENKYKKF